MQLRTYSEVILTNMSRTSSEIAAENVLRRTIGTQSEQFRLRLSDINCESEWFEVTARNGCVDVSGTSSSALCRGAYHYLKEACHVQVSWSGDEIRLSDKLPEFDKVRVVCPNRLRLYMSVCTFGYSTVWWDWRRWEQEIDWMALHGINMPLAMVGQEAIWQRVFRDLGLSDSEIEAHFTGPAFLPWHRMGNIDGHMGPLPQAWIASQSELQRRILDRERELGMMPVVPGFSGFVPPAFKRIHPAVELHSAEPWAGFPPTTYIDPRSEWFAEIGSRFVKEYQREYGLVHHYLCDTFAEQVPQIEPNGEVDYLCALGKATWKGLLDADPECHWVMQGWPFFFAQEYWSRERSEAFLGAVPIGRLIVIDQVLEDYEVWRDQPLVREKGWIHAAVHNFGQTTHLHGDLSAISRRGWEAIQDPNHGNMLGMGLVPEGIDQNPVLYELLTDAMWRFDRVDVPTWLHAYVLSRYGSAPQSAVSAWDELLHCVYGKEAPFTLRFCWRFRPDDQPIVRSPSVLRVFSAGVKLLDALSEIGPRRGFNRDLVDVTKTWLGGLAELVLDSTLLAWRKQSGEYDHYKSLFVQILLDLDRLLATLPEHRLSTWLSAARAGGSTADEADHLEVNARALLTHWGKPFLFDYATREWAGLTKDFHLERWRMYFEYLEHLERDGSVQMPDFPDWEERWARTIQPLSDAPFEDPALVAKELTVKYSGLVESSTQRHEMSRLYGPVGATSVSSNNKRLTLMFDLEESQQLNGIAIHPIHGQGFHGSYAVEISADGESWDLLPGESANTYRGARRAFDSSSVRSIRFEIEPDRGEPSQLFQILTFSDGCL